MIFLKLLILWIPIIAVFSSTTAKEEKINAEDEAELWCKSFAGYFCGRGVSNREYYNCMFNLRSTFPSCKKYLSLDPIYEVSSTAITPKPPSVSEQCKYFASYYCGRGTTNENYPYCINKLLRIFKSCNKYLDPNPIYE